VISIYKRRKRQRNELCNVFEIKLAVITEDKAGKSNEEFCKGWMDVDEILTLDVFRRKFAKVNFVKPVETRINVMPRE